MRGQTKIDFIVAAANCFRQKKYAEAIANYDKAIALDPYDAVLYNNRGIVYKSYGYSAVAIDDFTKAIALDPKFTFAYCNRGTAYKEQGDLAAAITDFSKAIELDPTDAKIYHNRGIVYKSQGYVVEAIADYSKAIALNSKYAMAYYNRGVAYYAQVKAADAVADFSKAIQLNPELFNKLSNDVKNKSFLQALREAATSNAMQGYLELLNLCVKHGMKTSEILDLLEQPLDEKHAHNTASVVSYFKDKKLLATYHALLKRCADNEDNVKRIDAILGKTIEGFGFLNFGGGITLAALFKNHGITDLPAATTSSATVVKPTAVAVPTFNTTTILQLTGVPLETVYIPRDQLRLMSQKQITVASRSRTPSPTATALYAELEKLDVLPKSSGEVQRTKVKVGMMH